MSPRAVNWTTLTRDQTSDDSTLVTSKAFFYLTCASSPLPFICLSHTHTLTLTDSDHSRPLPSARHHRDSRDRPAALPRTRPLWVHLPGQRLTHARGPAGCVNAIVDMHACMYVQGITMLDETCAILRVEPPGGPYQCGFRRLLCDHVHCSPISVRFEKKRQSHKRAHSRSFSHSSMPATKSAALSSIGC